VSFKTYFTFTNQNIIIKSREPVMYVKTKCSHTLKAIVDPLHGDVELKLWDFVRAEIEY
jgi:hypothetical protein